MQIVNLSQRTPEWLAWRRGGVSASEASILLGRNPYKTLWRLWAEKTGVVAEEDLSQNVHVRRGIALEDNARQAAENALTSARSLAEELVTEILLPVCAQSSAHPIIRASYDGIRLNREPVEVKCPCEKVWYEVVNQGETSRPYQLYLPQVQQQICISDVDKGWLLFYSPENNGEHRLFEVPRDQNMLNELLKASYDFWGRIQHHRPPEKDLKRDVYIPEGFDAVLWEAESTQYCVYEAQKRRFKEQLKTVEQAQRVHLDTMKSQMGDFNTAEFGGMRIHKFASNAKLDFKTNAAIANGEMFPAPPAEPRAPDTRYRVTVSGNRPSSKAAAPPLKVVQGSLI